MNISNVNPALPNVTISVPNNNPPQKEPGKSLEDPQPVSSEAVNQMLEQIQSQIQPMNISVSFSTYGDKNRDISVIVTNKNTGEVIREIPPEDLQKLYTKMEQLIGTIFHKSA